MAQPRASYSQGICHRCFIPGCPNSSEHDAQSCVWTREYYPFPPRTTQLYGEWLRVIGYDGQEPQAWHRVCSDHFPEGEGEREGSIPSIFPWTTAVVDVSDLSLPVVASETMPLTQKVWLKNIETGAMQQIEVSPEVAVQLQKDLAGYDPTGEQQVAGDTPQAMILEQENTQDQTDTLIINDAHVVSEQPGGALVIDTQPQVVHGATDETTLDAMERQNVSTGIEQTVVIEAEGAAFQESMGETLIIQAIGQGVSGDGSEAVLMQAADDQNVVQSEVASVHVQAIDQNIGGDVETVYVQVDGQNVVGGGIETSAVGQNVGGDVEAVYVQVDGQNVVGGGIETSAVGQNIGGDVETVYVQVDGQNVVGGGIETSAVGQNVGGDVEAVYVQVDGQNVVGGGLETSTVGQNVGGDVEAVYVQVDGQNVVAGGVQTVADGQNVDGDVETVYLQVNDQNVVGEGIEASAVGQNVGGDVETVYLQVDGQNVTGGAGEPILVQANDQTIVGDGVETIYMQAEDHNIVGSDLRTILVQAGGQNVVGAGVETIIMQSDGQNVPACSGDGVFVQSNGQNYTGAAGETIIMQADGQAYSGEAGETVYITADGQNYSADAGQTIIMQADGQNYTEAGQTIIMQSDGQNISAGQTIYLQAEDGSITDGSNEMIIVQQPPSTDDNDQPLQGSILVIPETTQGDVPGQVLTEVIPETTQGDVPGQVLTEPPSVIVQSVISEAQVQENTMISGDVSQSDDGSHLKKAIGGSASNQQTFGVITHDPVVYRTPSLLKRASIAAKPKKKPDTKTKIFGQVGVTDPRGITTGNPEGNATTPPAKLRVCVVCDKVTSQQIQGSSCIISTRIPTLKQAKARFPDLNNIAGYVCHKCKKMIADVQGKQEQEELDLAGGEESQMTEQTNVPPDFLSQLNLVPQSEIKAKASQNKKRKSRKKSSLKSGEDVDSKASPKWKPIIKFKPGTIEKPVTRKSLTPQETLTPHDFDPNSYVCVGCETKMERYKRGYARWTLSIVANLAKVKSTFPHLDSVDGYVCYNCRKLLVADKDGDESAVNKDDEPTARKTDNSTCVCCTRPFKTYKNKSRLCRWTLSVVSDFETAQLMFPHLESLAGYCCTSCKTKLSKEINPMQAELDNNCIVCKYKFQAYSKSNHRYRLANCAPLSTIKSVFPQLNGNEGYVCYKCRGVAVNAHKRILTGEPKRKRKHSESSTASQNSSDNSENKDIISSFKKKPHRECVCVACSQSITAYSPDGSLIRWRLEHISHHTTTEEVFPKLKKGSEGYICKTCRNVIVNHQLERMDSVDVKDDSETNCQQPAIKNSHCVCCASRFRKNYKGFVRWFLARITKPEIIKKNYPNMTSLEGYACTDCKAVLNRAELFERKNLLSQTSKQERKRKHSESSIDSQHTSDYSETIEKKIKIHADDTESISISKRKPHRECVCVACSQSITAYSPDGSLIRWRLEHISHHTTNEELFPKLKKGSEGYICETCRNAIVKLQLEQMDSVDVQSDGKHNLQQPVVISDSNCVCCSNRFRENYKGFVRWVLAKITKPAIIKKTYPKLASLEGYACSNCRTVLYRAELFGEQTEPCIDQPDSSVVSVSNEAKAEIPSPDSAGILIHKPKPFPSFTNRFKPKPNISKPQVSKPDILCKTCDKNLSGQKAFHLKRVASLHRLLQVFSKLTNRKGHLCIDCFKLFKNKIKLMPKDFILSISHVGHKEDDSSRAVLVGLEHGYSMSSEVEPPATDTIPLDMEAMDITKQEPQLFEDPAPDDNLLNNSDPASVIAHSDSSVHGVSWDRTMEDDQSQAVVEIMGDAMTNFLGELSDETMIPEFIKDHQTELFMPGSMNTNNMVFIPGTVGESPGMLYQINSADVPAPHDVETSVTLESLLQDGSVVPLTSTLDYVDAPEPVTQLQIQSDQKPKKLVGVRSLLEVQQAPEIIGVELEDESPVKVEEGGKRKKKKKGEGSAETKRLMAPRPGSIKKKHKGINLSLSEVDYTAQKVRHHIKQNDIANMFHWLYTMENGRFRKGFLSTVRTIIKNEIRGKKKKILKSLTGQLDPQSVAEFEWKKVVSEASSQAPMLSTALDAAFPPEEVKSPRFSQLENVYEARKGVILSIIYNSVSPQCTLPQNILGLQLWKHGVSQKVFNMLDILGVGPNEAKHSDNNKVYRNFTTSAKETFDAWKSIAEVSAIEYDTQEKKTREPAYSLLWRGIATDRGPGVSTDHLPAMTCLYAVRHRVSPTMLKSPTIPARYLTPDVFIPTNENRFRYRARMIQVVQRILITRLKMYSSMNPDGYQTKHRCSADMLRKSEIVSLGVLLQDTSTQEGRLAVADALQSYGGQVEGHVLPVLCGGDDRSVQLIHDVQHQRCSEDSATRRLQGLIPMPQETSKEKTLLQDIVSELYDPSHSEQRGTLSNIETCLHMNAPGGITDDLQGARDMIQITTEAFVALLAMKMVGISDRDEYPEDFDRDDPAFLTGHLKRVAVHIVEECWEEPPYEEIQRVRDLMQSDDDKYEYPYCYCQEDKPGEKIRCSYRDCPRQWLHYECLNGTPDQVDNWYCCTKCRDAAAKPGAFIYCWCKHDDGQAMIQCERQEKCSRYQWYHTTCEGLDPQNPPEVWYCCEKCALKRGTDDGLLEYYRHLLWRGLSHLVEKEAVNNGDGPAMLRNWKINMVNFWNKDHVDVMKAGHMLLACVGGFASPQLIHELTWERVANLYGDDAKNVGLDTVTDLLTQEFKDIIRHKERVKSAKHMDIAAKSVGELSIQTDRILNLNSGIGHSDSKSSVTRNMTVYHETDQAAINNLVGKVIDEYGSDRLFNYSPLRTPSDFPSFDCRIREPDSMAFRLRTMSRDLDRLKQTLHAPVNRASVASDSETPEIDAS